MLFDTPTYTWWPEHTVEAVRATHRWLEDYIDEHGPYDAVCCFSQGCSLAGSYLLDHAKHTPTFPLPFRSAIFICGGLPLPFIEDLGLDVPHRAHELHERTAALMRAKSAMLYDIDKLPKGQGLWDNTTDLEHDHEELPPETDCFGLDFTTFPDNIRIKIPTVHIYGAKDPRWPTAIQLAYICDDRKMYDHLGGHDIPRTSQVSETIAELVREVTGN